MPLDDSLALTADEFRGVLMADAGDLGDVAERRLLRAPTNALTVSLGLRRLLSFGRSFGGQVLGVGPDGSGEPLVDFSMAWYRKENATDANL
jgi:hypothetical protein